MTIRFKKSILPTILLLIFATLSEAGVYIDGGLSYRRTDDVNGTGMSDTISITDVLIGYQDNITLPFGLGNAKDTYDIRGRYRRASYSSSIDLDYTEWQFTGKLRKFINQRWWILFSGEYLLINADNNIDGLDRVSLGAENGYRLTPNLLLTTAYRFRSTSFDNTDDINNSHGVSVGAKYDFGDYFSAFVRYSVDEDYIDSLGFLAPNTRIETTQAGILLAINQQSALRLMYEVIDDDTLSTEVFSSDFVLRY